jgi:hypothetical protein
MVWKNAGARDLYVDMHMGVAGAAFAARGRRVVFQSEEDGERLSSSAP